MYSYVYTREYIFLQHIFYNDAPVYYNFGVYGWNFDAYIDYSTDTAITTGYRNMIGERIPDELIRKYDKKAREILKKYSWMDQKKRDKALEKNKEKFMKELLNL